MLLQPQRKSFVIMHNVVVGLAVSIIMLNLGAALGMLSGRGAFAGMLSAGIIAVITSAFGGTRIQGSGPTAPMGAVTAVIVAYAAEQLPQKVAGISADHFVNIVLFLTAIFLVLFSVLKFGRLIAYVPRLVISGFMCGIAMIIWILQAELLFGIGRQPIEGPVSLNLFLALATLAIAIIAGPLLKVISHRLATFLPGTLVALVVISALASLLQMPVEYLRVDNSINSLEGFALFIKSQIPTEINQEILLLAAPFALKLAALGFIDTLLTSLIVDKLRGTQTRQNQELAAQGVAMSAVALVGGVPGAQSTVPSVLTVKEGATMRLAGVCAGLFVIAELLVFAELMAYIPKAVFAGILIKVGYDVFDFKPFAAYWRTIRRKLQNRPVRILGHKEMGMVSGTAALTAFIDMIVAVGLFTIGFHLLQKLFPQRRVITDYVP